MTDLRPPRPTSRSSSDPSLGSLDSFDALLAEAAHAPPLPLVDPLFGEELGPYRIESRLGVGGMGTVYRARDARLEREVAVKVLPARDETLHEARYAARASHPNIAAIHDVGQDGVRSWIAFELIEGGTLAERLAHADLSRSDALRVARGLADALRHLHDRGLVHGDLSPNNVLFRGDAPVLVDFGLASEQGTVRAAGTRGFVAPEVLAGGPRDARSDVFAYGVLLASLPELPSALRRLAARCTDAEAAARPADGAALVDALRARRSRAAGVGVALVGAIALTGALFGVLRTAAAPRAAAEPIEAPTAAPPDVATDPPARSAAEPSLAPAEQLTFHTEEGGIVDAAVSPDGALVALLDVSGAWLLGLEDGRRRPLPLPPTAGAPQAVSWVAQGRALLSAEGGAFLVDPERASVTPLSLPPGRARGALSGAVSIATDEGLLLGRLEGHRFVATAPGPELDGTLAGCAWSPDGAQLAMLVFDDEDTSRLLIHRLSTRETRALAVDGRLVADSGVGAVAFYGADRLVVGLAGIPGEGLSAELVTSAASRWAPVPLRSLEHPASRLSVDRNGYAVFAQSILQSDTVAMRWDGASLHSLERLSLSSRDDRPTDWTTSGGLLGMLRVGGEHRVVRFPDPGGTPAPVAPGGWWTWPQQTALGVVGFRPEPDGDGVAWARAEQGSVHTLAHLAERVGDEGTGRAVPRDWAFACAYEGRCALVDGRDGVRVSIADARDGTREGAELLVSPEPQRLYHAACDRAFRRVAVAAGGRVFVLDVARRAVTATLVAPDGGIYQYLASDPRSDGWFVSGLSPRSPSYRMHYVTAGSPPRLLRGDDHTWMANPTPSPSGARLAFSTMRLRSDLYRVRVPD